MTAARLRIDWLALWVLWSAWASSSGWILSALGHLDRAGYAISILLFVLALASTRRWWSYPSERPIFLLRRATYSRLAPKLWLALVVVSFVGGLCFHADNYDYLSYRFPRLLYWWWHHHWYWIDTLNDRRNLSATGMEWLMAPLFVLFRTDRPFFLINIVSFLFLPGLILSIFRNLGISGRIAWWWMWVLPAGICFCIQAGGMGNDMFTAVYLLAAFHYGAKARKDSLPALALSILSIALLTGGKASNVPLAAPWLVMMAVDRPFRWNPRTLAVVFATGLIAALVSILPVLLANGHFSGDFGGDPTNGHKVKLSDPLAGVLGNSIMLILVNLSPPIWPHDVNWTIVPAGLVSYIRHGYPRFLVTSSALQLEESCSLGLGVTVFWLISLVRGIRARLAGAVVQLDGRTVLIAVGMIAAWLGYMTKLGSEAVPRLVAPYYVLTVAVTLALLPLNGAAARSKIWRAIGCLALLLGLAVILLTPGRPLLPGSVLSNALLSLHVSHSTIDRLQENRVLREGRFDDMKSLREAIPATEKVVGIIVNGDDPNVSIWLPFGTHEVMEINPATVTREGLTSRNIHYVAASGTVLSTHHMVIGDLLKKWNAEIVRQQDLTFKTLRGPESWYLLRLR